MNNERIYYSQEAEIRAMRNRTVLALVFMTFGLGIGAALALLFAPSSGKTTRHEIAESVDDGLHASRETVEPIIKRLEDQFNDLRKNVEEHLKQD
jgi:gas vesicle protein